MSLMQTQALQFEGPQFVNPFLAAKARLAESDFKRSLRAACRAVEKDARMLRRMSDDDRSTVVLILNRPDLLPPHLSVLCAIERLQKLEQKEGLDVLAVCREVQAEGWHFA